MKTVGQIGQLGIFLTAILAAVVEVDCRWAIFQKRREDAVYVAAGLVIKKRALERLRTAHSPVRRFKAGDATPGLSRPELIFRALLNEMQAQSPIATRTRNIPELGISENKAR